MHRQQQIAHWLGSWLKMGSVMMESPPGRWQIVQSCQKNLRLTIHGCWYSTGDSMTAKQAHYHLWQCPVQQENLQENLLLNNYSELLSNKWNLSSGCDACICVQTLCFKYCDCFHHHFIFFYAQSNPNKQMPSYFSCFFLIFFFLYTSFVVKVKQPHT